MFVELWIGGSFRVGKRELGSVREVATEVFSEGQMLSWCSVCYSWVSYVDFGRGSFAALIQNISKQEQLLISRGCQR